MRDPHRGGLLVGFANTLIHSAWNCWGNKGRGKYKKITIPTWWLNCDRDPVIMHFLMNNQDESAFMTNHKVEK
ncbi:MULTISPECIES: hypothetical protein [Enterobacterales]|uniref:hypothetical protein n=1 Tax=Enterobacterales TaxID=91347 RepID=UPI002EDAE813